MRRILIVDDQAEAFRETFQLLFPDDRLTLCSTGEEALALVRDDVPFDAALLDVRMPAALGTSDEEEGLAVLARLKEERPELPAILLSVISNVETVVRGMRLGAFYYVEKPPDAKRLRHLVDRAVAQARTEAESRALRASIDVRDRMAEAPAPTETVDRLGALVGSSEVMQRLYARLTRAAASRATVLVLGESGTGKELAAAELHRLSPRAAKPFRVVNCPALPRELLESTLFGHTKGSFTGATQDKKGEFVLADGGTLFLDEIGDLDLDLQAKLLRVLEQGDVHPIGASDPVHVDVRIVAATNRDLRAQIGAGAFREDLYYRLNVVRVTMPASARAPGGSPGHRRGALRASPHGRGAGRAGPTHVARQCPGAEERPRAGCRPLRRRGHRCRRHRAGRSALARRRRVLPSRCSRTRSTESPTAGPSSTSATNTARTHSETSSPAPSA